MRLNLPKSRMFWAVSLGHLVNDMFTGMGPVLLAFLSVSLVPMTNTQIGLAVTATALMGALTQPIFGVLADRSGGRLQGILGVAWTVTFFSMGVLAARTGQFWLIFIPLVLGAIGSGAFHPAGASLAADSNPLRAGRNMSYFFLMGQVGLATGPFVVGQMLELSNPSRNHVFNTPFAPAYDIPFLWSASVMSLLLVSLFMIPTVILMITSLKVNPRRTMEKPARKAEQNKLDVPVKAMVILGLMIGIRSLAHPGAVTFVPKLFQDKGWSPAQYGGMVSVFWMSSALSGVFIGNLADRFDRRWVVMMSMVLSVPCFYLLPVVDGVAAVGLAILAGGMTGGTHSTIVVMAQELIPGARGLASGSVLGFIFAMGAVGSFLIGTVSDMIGLSQTFQIVSFLLLIAGGLTLLIPTPAKPPPPPSVVTVMAGAEATD